MAESVDREQSSPTRTASGAAGRRRLLGAGSDRLAFGLGGVVLLASALMLVALGESEWPMFVLCLGGLLAGKLVGLPERHLAIVAFAVTAVAWPIAFFSSPIPRATSTFAHIFVAALLAWAIAGPVRRRWPQTVASPWSLRWFAIPLIVLAIGLVWELGEWTGDALLETDLTLGVRDTLADLVADFLGAVVGLALRDRARRSRVAPQP